jgi:hypothetical protein
MNRFGANINICTQQDKKELPFFVVRFASQHDSAENAITHTLVNYHKQFDAVDLNAHFILICQEDYLLHPPLAADDEVARISD